MSNILYVKTNDLPPTINHMYYAYIDKKTRKPRLYKSSEAKKYQKLLENESKNSCNGQIYDPKGIYALVIKITQPTNQRDVDNSIKIIVDGILKGIGVNDRYCYSVTAVKLVDKEKEPGVEVWFGELGEVVNKILPRVHEHQIEYIYS